jgi:hypothetical protein
VFARAIEENWLGKKMYYELAHALGGTARSRHRGRQGADALLGLRGGSRYLNAGVPGIKIGRRIATTLAGCRAGHHRLYTQELDGAKALLGAGPEKIAEIEAGLGRAPSSVAHSSPSTTSSSTTATSASPPYRLGVGDANRRPRSPARKLAAEHEGLVEREAEIEVVASPAELALRGARRCQGAFWRGKVYLVRHNIAEREGRAVHDLP